MALMLIPDKAVGVNSRNRIAFLYILIVLLFVSCATTGNSGPKWFTDIESVYPSEKYISAIGEGTTLQEAQSNAISQISLYFDTDVTVNRELVNSYNEIQTNNSYFAEEIKQINEETSIRSQSKFFCVQFSSSSRIGGLFYTVAFIDKEKAYQTYKQNISYNTKQLEALIPFAEQTDNPFYCAPAIKKGIVIARYTSQLVKNIITIYPDANADYAKTEQLIKRMTNAYKNSRNTLSVNLEIERDWNGTVYRTLSTLLEQNGISITRTPVQCNMKASITPNRIENDAGIFLTCGIIVNVYNASAENIFSYTREFEREGAPREYEEVAWRKAYNTITDELNNSFLQEFNTRLYGE